VPYLPHGVVLSPDSTSFPSGHAIYFFALVTALWSASAALGLFGALHAFFVVCVPRMYLGFHYPTDILVGAVFGIVTVAAVNAVLPRSSIMQRLLVWSERRPAAFYSLFFLSTLEITTEFANVKTVLYLLR